MYGFIDSSILSVHFLCVSNETTSGCLVTIADEAGTRNGKPVMRLPLEWRRAPTES